MELRARTPPTPLTPSAPVSNDQRRSTRLLLTLLGPPASRHTFTSPGPLDWGAPPTSPCRGSGMGRSSHLPMSRLWTGALLPPLHVGALDRGAPPTSPCQDAGLGRSSHLPHAVRVPPSTTPPLRV
eukprot:351201-Chlamydomonas_euryale.AAC.7